MISPGKTLAAATLAAATVLAQAAHADVIRSDMNGAGTMLADEMGLLLGNEKSRLNTFAGAELVSIAAGPAEAKAEAKPAAVVAADEKKTTKVIRRSTAAGEKAPAAAENAEPEEAGKKLTRVNFGKKTTGGAAEKTAQAPAEADLPMPKLRYDAAWLMAQPAPESSQAWQCLTEAIYFEARGESLKGQFAVAEVILNRVDSGLYPRSVCGVVRQRGGGGCQFSYVCNGNSTRMSDRAARELAGRIASVMLQGAPRGLTNGATHFHTHAVKPSWSRHFARTTVIGAHNFYREPGVRG